MHCLNGCAVDKMISENGGKQTITWAEKKFRKDTQRSMGHAVRFCCICFWLLSTWTSSVFLQGRMWVVAAQIHKQRQITKQINKQIHKHNSFPMRSRRWWQQANAKATYTATTRSGSRSSRKRQTKCQVAQPPSLLGAHSKLLQEIGSRRQENKHNSLQRSFPHSCGQPGIMQKVLLRTILPLKVVWQKTTTHRYYMSEYQHADFDALCDSVLEIKWSASSNRQLVYTHIVRTSRVHRQGVSVRCGSIVRIICVL